MSEIEIFTQPGCPYCVHAVDLLRSKGVAFKEINAPHGTREREESMSRSAQDCPSGICEWAISGGL